MQKIDKRIILYIAFGVGLFVLLMNISSFFGLFQTLYNMTVPVVIGFIMAFVLNVPMKGFVKLFNKLNTKLKHKLGGKVIELVSLVLVFVLLAALIWLTLNLAIPSLVNTFEDVYRIINEHLPELYSLMEQYDIDPAIVIQSIGKIFEFVEVGENGEMVFNFASLVGPVFSTAKSILTTVVQLIFAIVVCIYALMSKSEFRLQSRRLLHSLLPLKPARYLNHVYEVTRDCYSKFLVAQTIEACILGVMMFLAFTIFGLPYAGLVAVLTALFAYLPYIGAFGSCFVGAFLTLVAEPDKVILCVVVYTVVQFTENNFVYPHVVGDQIGLSPMWTLIAALVGGEFMGLFGMIFFIPLASALNVLLGEFTTARLAKRGISMTPEREIFPDDPPEAEAAEEATEETTEEATEAVAEETTEEATEAVAEERAEEATEQTV
ncbi:MAG: AI-2E family transporter [Clostridia bacterium]|nr:AI-2E family transporter [Clostridia bacterium]